MAVAIPNQEKHIRNKGLLHCIHKYYRASSPRDKKIVQVPKKLGWLPYSESLDKDEFERKSAASSNMLTAQKAGILKDTSGIRKKNKDLPLSKGSLYRD